MKKEVGQKVLEKLFYFLEKYEKQNPKEYLLAPNAESYREYINIANNMTYGYVIKKGQIKWKVSVKTWKDSFVYEICPDELKELLERALDKLPKR